MSYGLETHPTPLTETLCRDRAKAAGLRVRNTMQANQYTVRSRSLGYDHVVTVANGVVVACTNCEGFTRFRDTDGRPMCIHAGAVYNRLDRERTLISRGRQVRKTLQDRKPWSDPLLATR